MIGVRDKELSDWESDDEMSVDEFGVEMELLPCTTDKEKGRAWGAVAPSASTGRYKHDPDPRSSNPPTIQRDTVHRTS